MPPVDLLTKETLSDQQLKSASLEDVGRAVQGIHQLVKNYEGDNKTKNEAIVEMETRIKSLHEVVEKLRSQYPPEPIPVQPHVGDYAARKGGLFPRKDPVLKFLDILELHPRNPILRGEDKDLTQDLHDAWDACTFKMQVEKYTRVARPGPYAGNMEAAQRAAMDATLKGPDFRRLEKLMTYAGYGSDAEQLKTLIHAESGGIAAPLTFTLVSAQVIDLVRMALRVANQFRQIPLSHLNQKLPVNRGDALGVLGGSVATDPPPSGNITTLIPHIDMFGNITFGTADFDCKDIMAFLWWSDRAVVESMVPLVPYLRDMIVFAHARAIDRACLSGDIAATHMDDFTPNFTSRDVRHAWNGLRSLGYNTEFKLDNAGASFDSAEVRTIQKKMGVHGLSPELVAIWASPTPIFDMIGDANVLTVEKFGPQATIRTGTIAMVHGMSLIPTAWMPTDMDATNGVSTAIGTKTGVVAARTDRFGLGQYLTMAVETTRWAPMQTTIIQATGYYDFKPFEGVDATTKRFTTAATGAVAPVCYMVDVLNT